MLQAIHGDPLMRVSAFGGPTNNTQWGERDIPDDIHVLHDALVRLREHKQGEPLVLNLMNCGTALRFLQVHIDKFYPGEPITLTGDPRLLERLGKPTTQTASARILHGDQVPVLPDESPYITMSRRMAAMYQPSVVEDIERCWSSAAFWYEYMALQPLLYPDGPRELLLQGLAADSLQGDRMVADIYAGHFGVKTTFTSDGAIIVNNTTRQSIVDCQLPDRQLVLDFTNCPDLYPAIALTCERLGIPLIATGTERLAYKESNRLEAVASHQVRHDHRMAMALLVAGYPVDDTACIAKSYPSFLSQWLAVTKANE